MYKYLILSVSVKDIFHEAVKQALQKEQWVITDDPLKFKFGNINFQIDLGAERLIAASVQKAIHRLRRCLRVSYLCSDALRCATMYPTTS